MMAMSEERDEGRAMNLRTVALTAVLGLLLLLSIGAIGGAAAAWIKSPENWGAAVLAMAGAVLIGAAATLGLLKLKPWAGSGEPISPGTRKANNLLLLSGFIGGVLGAVLSLSMISLDDPLALFSNSPMPRAVVIPSIAVWLLIVPLISWQWHLSVDEHEEQSYQFGGLAALYLYSFLTPAWWLAARGGLLPAPDAMIIFMGVMLVWGIGWFWRRYR
jgi:hypothetical protein